MVQTLPDIAGDNAVHQISTNAILARWIAFGVTGSFGSNSVRVGDSNVGNGRGVSVAAASQLVFPDVPGGGGYRLDQIYAEVPTGNTLTITYGGVS